MYHSIQILLVEDNEGDVLLIKKAFADARLANKINVCRDGQEGYEFLKKIGDFEDAPTPDLILLDINMPRVTGLELLEIIKQDEQLKVIPVIMLTTSTSEEDILKSYQLHVSSFVQKPVEFVEFLDAVQQIQDYWFSIVRFPPKLAFS
ncbi:MAG: response regulator [Bacteroidota bacterium]